MHLRDQMKPLVNWQIDTRENCKVFTDPWIPDFVVPNMPKTGDKEMKVIELVNAQTNTWDTELLVELFGYQGCLKVISQVQPPSQEKGDDRLIFKPTTNGAFSVKKCYKALRQHVHEILTGTTTNGPSGGKIWGVIWKRKGVLPRLRLFLWKVIQKALPLEEILRARTSKGEAGCDSCGNEEENAHHMLFGCPFARAC